MFHFALLLECQFSGNVKNIPAVGGGGGGGVALARILFFGQSKRPKKIGTAKFFGVRFRVAHEATQQG